MSELVRIAINYLTRKKKHKLASAVSGEIERLNGDIENLVRARDYWSDAEKKAMQEAQRLKAENDHLTAEGAILQEVVDEAMNLEATRIDDISEMDRRQDALWAALDKYRASVSGIQPHSVEMPEGVDATLHDALRDSVTVVDAADSNQERMKPYLQPRCGDCGTLIDNCLDTCPECGSGVKALDDSRHKP
jgi:chromosome segregation ATPase